LKKYYSSGYFEGKKTGVGGYKNYQDLEKNLERESYMKIKYIKKRTKKGELLDIGAGTGVFAQIARNNGFNVCANDISKYANTVLTKRKIETFFGPINSKIFPKNRFQIVTAWDVVEHMSNVDEMILAVKSALKKGGYFFLTTPDTGSWDARLTGKKWYGYKKLPEHLIFLNRKSVTTLLLKHGFEVVEIIPWGFYRNLRFISDKLGNYGHMFTYLGKIINFLGINNISFFFPMTDFMVVGKKTG
jgi:SAM-dependent methyltransferase